MSGSKKIVAIVVAVLVFVLAAGAAVLVLSGDDESYTPETREAFVEACTADGGDDVESVCVCWYDSITQSIAYDRYDEANAELLAQLEADPESTIDIPADFEALLAECRPAA